MAQHRKPTDQAHKIQLSAKMVHALWISQAVCTGQKAPFEVWTRFVGNGADIRVEVIDRSGKKIDTINGKVYGNYFAAAAAIPDKAKEVVMFTARLPRHRLEIKSDICRVLPPGKIDQLAWEPKEAAAGDTVRLTASVTDIPEGARVMLSIYANDPLGAHDFITRFAGRVENRRIAAQWRFDPPRGLPTAGAPEPPQYF